jgi:RNA polymerase sigma-70 factor (ECF subfamily)
MSEPAQQLTQIVIAHTGALRLYASQILDDPSTADDVVQEAMVTMLTLASTIKPMLPVPWMYRVVRNAALDHLRSSKRRRRREEKVAGEQRQWFTTKSDGVVERDAVENAMARLDTEDREIVVLRVWGGLPFAEIGGIVHRSASTVHTRYEAALALMRTALEDPCDHTMTTRTK